MITKNPIYFFCGALLGSAIGVATALMLTPESGAEVRGQLRDLVLNGHTIKKKKPQAHSLTPHEHDKATSHKPKAKATAPKRPRKKAPDNKTTH